MSPSRVLSNSRFFSIAITCLMTPTLRADPPVELGTVNWLRDFDQALVTGKSDNKPILILFQEVPGCATCRNYGNDVLSHPLIRDAAENLFVPVAVYNNIEGKDRKVLNSFNEPTWNNPVVRIVDGNRKALAERVNGDYSAAGLVDAMVTALKAAKKDVPPYLALLHNELSAHKNGVVEQATFAMHCFWEGEIQFGKLDGVIATQAGWLEGEEVVDVWFDTRRIDFKTVLDQGKKVRCARRVFARSEQQKKQAMPVVGDAIRMTDRAAKPDKEPKYYLGKSTYRFVPMTPAQACRVNAALRDAKLNPDDYLSRSQRQLHAVILKHPKANWPVAFNTDNLNVAMKKATDLAKKSAA